MTAAKNFYFLIIGITIVSIFTNKCVSANKCVLRGSCGLFESQIFGGIYQLPCAYSGEPQPLKDESALKILKSVTPELFNATNPVFCCDDQQVLDVTEQLLAVQLIVQNCPSCYVNLAKLYYHMNCAPNQIEFLDVTAVSNSSSGKQIIDELTYYASERYAINTYTSCKDVHFPSSDEKVMAVLCGEWGAQNCSAQRLLTNIGKRDPFPLQINFNLTNANAVINAKNISFVPLNPKTVLCSEAPVGYSNSSCKCVDCPC